MNYERKKEYTKEKRKVSKKKNAKMNQRKRGESATRQARVLAHAWSARPTKLPRFFFFFLTPLPQAI